LVGFAFASALEATINTLELEQIERRMLLLAATNAAFERVEQQLKSQRMQSRYPHIVSLVADARQQLSSTQGFLDKAYKLRSSGDLEGATNALVDGLKRHPQSTELWKLYLETQVLLVQRGDGVDDAFRKLLVRIERIEELNMISPFQKHFYCAVLHERLGDIQNSLQEYESAVVAAKQSRDRILARSKVSQLRVRDTVRN
jgi:predicted negative regulator of RcsB-dependent stress response